IDLDGRPIVPLKFEAVRNFSGGIAPAQENGLWGLLKKDGSWLVAPQYEEVIAFQPIPSPQAP
ncbi:MAG: WG repeat-containing protein, partial [Sphingobacteriia bacterium]